MVTGVVIMFLSNKSKWNVVPNVYWNDVLVVSRSADGDPDSAAC
jgi:hypothetical protein